jgi:predicted signal transduction protein with EAL and GGDEF domain
MMSNARARRFEPFRLVTIITSGFGAASLAFIAMMLFGSNTTGPLDFTAIGGAIAALSAFAGAGSAYTFLANAHRNSAESEISGLSDPMTNLLSRSGLEHELNQLNDRLSQQTGGDGRWLIASVEIDAFRDINDTHGLETGDTVLRVVAVRLARLIGKLGPVARIGGSEVRLRDRNEPR